MTINYLTPRPYDELFNQALLNAIYWQNLCCELKEIIEMFCLDAEAAHGIGASL